MVFTVRRGYLIESQLMFEVLVFKGISLQVGFI